MKQRTLKDIVEILKWIEHNPHHEAGTYWAKGKSKQTGFYEHGEETHFFLKNYQEKILVPLDVWRECRKLIGANPRPFDTRMFALTEQGRRCMNGYNYAT